MRSCLGRDVNRIVTACGASRRFYVAITVKQSLFRALQYPLHPKAEATLVGKIRRLASGGNSGVEVTNAKRDVMICQSKDGKELVNMASGGCCGGSNREKSDNQLKEDHMMELQNLIRECHQEARYDEALSASQALVDRCEEHFGKRHPATASAYNNAAVMHKMLGQFDRARERYHDALKLYQELVGSDHASYATALNNLGNLLRTQADVDEDLTSLQRWKLTETAIDHFEEALKIRRAELGEDHPHTLTSLSNLGGALASQTLQKNDGGGKTVSHALRQTKQSSKFDNERWTAAESYLRAALKLSIQNQSKTSKGDHSNRDPQGRLWTLAAAAAAQNLAVFLKVRADQLDTLSGEQNVKSSCGEKENPSELYAEAKKLYEDALTVRVGRLGEAHPETIATKFSLAELVFATGDENGSNIMRQEIMESLNGNADIKEH